MPRSPTITTRDKAKRCRSFSTCRLTVLGGVALEHLDSHGTPLAVTQQAEDDLELAALAVPGIAMFGQRTRTALEVTGGEVVEDHGAFGQVLFRQPLLDGLLTFHQPVHGRVEFVLIGVLHPQFLSQTVREGVRLQTSGSGQLGARAQDARGNQRHRQIPQAGALRPKQAFHTTAPQGVEHRSHMTMGPGPQDGEGILFTWDCGAAPEQGAESFDQGLRPVGEVGEGSLRTLPFWR